EDRIDGRDITDAQQRDRDIAMVYQSYSHYPHKTVRKNIAYPLKLDGVSAPVIAERVKD
ncbi:MAG: Glycerol-3-phosphate transporter, ATP-binding protein UgpC, partial [Ilumatobacteraceae bacterium]|nr:Glycerol-3-phosphate transporter, ATP-binding protein UgpC [Ilumatobacteraceae bacterium]